MTIIKEIRKDMIITTHSDGRLSSGPKTKFSAGSIKLKKAIKNFLQT
jgi:hypothetical protein